MVGACLLWAARAEWAHARAVWGPASRCRPPARAPTTCPQENAAAAAGEKRDKAKKSQVQVVKAEVGAGAFATCSCRLPAFWPCRPGRHGTSGLRRRAGSPALLCTCRPCTPTHAHGSPSTARCSRSAALSRHPLPPPLLLQLRIATELMEAASKRVEQMEHVRGGGGWRRGSAGRLPPWLPHASSVRAGPVSTALPPPSPPPQVCDMVLDRMTELEQEDRLLK